MRTVLLRSSAAGPSRHGHPWVWQRAVLQGLKGVVVGEEVRLASEQGDEFLGRGLADPSSPIAVRIWTRREEAIDANLFRRRAQQACAIRSTWFAGSTTTAATAAEGGETNAYRVLNGEGDRMPGVVIDRYADVGVLRLDGDGIEAHAREIVDAIWPTLEGLGLRSLFHRRGKETLGIAGASGAAPARIEVREHGVPFVVDLAHGQKTGAFLDQRENRRRVGALARGRRVLNLFSYAGGFSLHAALGGAEHVTSVDIAARAHATAQDSFRLAGIDPKKHAFASADVFAFLGAAKARGEKWDLVVSDPPSFAPSEKAVPNALAAYRSLHRACADVLGDRGILCAASCSSHVDARMFAATLDDHALGRDDLRILESYGPPADHPTTAAWAEGRYLKFVVVA